jgi:hypothetical protein
MAKRPTEAALRAQKDAKQKKLLFVLVPLFLLLLVWQGPKTLKAFQGGSSAAPPPPPVATTTTTPSATPGSPTPSSEATSLPDTDVVPELLDGQLVSFSRFHGRDPFALSGSSGGSGGSSAPTAAGATIEVNGTSESVPLDGSFPSDDPTFKLVSVSGESADIGLVSGSFSNGAETISINVGETLVLVADDGARYAIKLVSVASS